MAYYYTIHTATIYAGVLYETHTCRHLVPFEICLFLNKIIRNRPGPRPQQYNNNKKDGWNNFIRTHYPGENAWSSYLAVGQGRTSHSPNRYDKRNKNGFTAFQFWFYREFNLLNNEAKQLYVSGWYQLVPTTQPILEIPDDIDEDNRWWYCVVGIL